MGKEMGFLGALAPGMGGGDGNIMQALEQLGDPEQVRRLSNLRLQQMLTPKKPDYMTGVDYSKITPGARTELAEAGYVHPGVGMLEYQQKGKYGEASDIDINRDLTHKGRTKYLKSGDLSTLTDADDWKDREKGKAFGELSFGDQKKINEMVIYADKHGIPHDAARDARLQSPEQQEAMLDFYRNQGVKQQISDMMMLMGDEERDAAGKILTEMDKMMTRIHPAMIQIGRDGATGKRQVKIGNKKPQTLKYEAATREGLPKKAKKGALAAAKVDGRPILYRYTGYTWEQISR
jgi:hypothetical protein